MTGVARTTDPYDQDATAETFDVVAWLDSIDPALWNPENAEARRELTRLDPMLFAMLYLTHHLTSEDTGDAVTFADCHIEWYRLMRTWARRKLEPREWRHSFAAPRSTGKSTVWFLIAPLWAGAHGHVRFVAAFADSGTQAEMHLQSFRKELAGNALLRRDYPSFCQAQRKPTGRTVADNEGMFQSCNGFVFAARGADTATLGMKVGNQRPDALVLDDIEKHEAQYSLDMVKKRLGTIINAIFPLNERARVVIVGTTTRDGSIVHQLVQVADGDRAPEGDEYGWIAEERVEPHHHLPIVSDEDDGPERSIWPGKWNINYLKSIEHTRSFELNMLCNPRSAGGELWDSDDILYGAPGPVARVFAWLDPPVTAKKRSDPAGFTIAGYMPTLPDVAALVAETFPDPERAKLMLSRFRGNTGRATPGGVLIMHAEEIRKTGTPLLRHVAGSIARFEARWGKRVRTVLCDVTQGGDLWGETAEHVSLPLKGFTLSEGKDWRFARTLDHYQALRVWHAVELPVLERQQLAYPKLANDDVLDSAAAAVLAFLEPKPTRNSTTIHPM